MEDNEYNKTARLLVKGHVQGVGYRIIVFHIARQMKILGTINNLDNGDVEIFSKCKDKNQLNDFIDRIEIKSKSKNIYRPNVESIEKEIILSRIEKYNPPKQYKTFQIDYGDIEPHEKELLIKMDTGSRIMFETSDNVANKVYDMHNEMSSCFETMNTKYDSISKRMEEVHSDLKSMSDCFRDLVNHVIGSKKKNKTKDKN